MIVYRSKEYLVMGAQRGNIEYKYIHQNDEFLIFNYHQNDEFFNKIIYKKEEK